MRIYGARGDPHGATIPKTMSRVWVSVEPRGFWAVQRYMEPLSSAGTRSNTSSLPSCSALPSRSRLPTRVHVKRGSGKTSFCGEMGGSEMGVEGEQTLSRTWRKDEVEPKCPGVHQCRDHDVTQGHQANPIKCWCGCKVVCWQWNRLTTIRMGGDADLEALHQDPHSVSNAGSRRGHCDLRALGSDCKGRGEEGTSAERGVPGAGGCPWPALMMV